MNAELATVGANLFAVADTLESPLSDLVRAQIKRSQPFLRASIVLAAGFIDPDCADLQTKRIHLASALELLYVALGIHKLLLGQSEIAAGRQIDKAIVGSTVLAGDYCFSRSAAFAAQTDSPKVVTLFASALKDVSEDHLRYAFGYQSDGHKEARVLFEAGIRTASVLTLLPAAEVEEMVYASSHLASAKNGRGGAAFQIDKFPLCQQGRWSFVNHLFTADK